MSTIFVPEPQRHTITREGLLDGTFLERARAIPGLQALSDEQLEESLDSALASKRRTHEVWIFAYGSLIWNPAFEYEDRVGAVVKGWHRSFCLSAPFGRGTPENPTLFLALNQGGSAEGVAYKLPKGREREELLLVWRREMFSEGYRAEWVKLLTGTDAFWALTFVANPGAKSFVGELAPRIVAERLRSANGPLGTGLEYLTDTIRHLEDVNLRDPRLDRIKKLIDAGQVTS